MSVDSAKAIRAALKAAGYPARSISVRNDSYSMGSTVHVTIKSPDVRLDHVEAIAEAFERVSRDASGEILSGGNMFVHVGYARGALDDAEARVAEQLRAGRAVFGSLQMHASAQDPDELHVWNASSYVLRLSRRYDPAKGLTRILAASGQLGCLDDCSAAPANDITALRTGT